MIRVTGKAAATPRTSPEAICQSPRRMTRSRIVPNHSAPSPLDNAVRPLFLEVEMNSGIGKTLEHLLILSCLVISITTLADETPEFALRTTSTPAKNPAVAYLYVSQQPNTPGPNQVSGLTVHENGALSPIEGSPFSEDIGAMAVNGKYLFGATTDNLYLNSYTIEPNGALRFSIANDLTKITGDTSDGIEEYMVLDHSGANLYNFRYEGSQAFYSFAINKTTGALTLTRGKQLGFDSDLSGWITFGANNKYVYSTVNGEYEQSLYDFERATDGALLPGTAGPENGFPIPAPRTGEHFIPMAVAADPSNHVAVSMQREEWNGSPGDTIGEQQLATYTADAKGNLTTTSGWKNMPTVNVGDLTWMRMSPSGKLLAVSGSRGLQIFHFNGREPITSYATLVPNVSFGDVRWDDNNHLFAAGSNGKLYVFTITPTGITQAPGSPIAIPGAQSLTVQPLL